MVTDRERLQLTVFKHVTKFPVPNSSIRNTVEINNLLYFWTTQLGLFACCQYKATDKLVFCNDSTSQFVIIFEKLQRSNSILKNCNPQFIKNLIQGRVTSRLEKITIPRCYSKTVILHFFMKIQLKTSLLHALMISLYSSIQLPLYVTKQHLVFPSCMDKPALLSKAISFVYAQYYCLIQIFLPLSSSSPDNIHRRHA